MRFFLALLVSSFFFGTLCFAEIESVSQAHTDSVITPAPDIMWQENGRLTHLSSLRGKPVLLLIAPSPQSHIFLSQLNELKGMYGRLANRQLICVAAFYEEEGLVPSNIPFITANKGAAVAAVYGVQKNSFAAALISVDGNLDCLSTKVLPGQRIDDLIDASYATQLKMRKP
ncbi:MAG: DUF4174 domain-containing protein [Chthoniobacterales bacterium]